MVMIKKFETPEKRKFPKKIFLIILGFLSLSVVEIWVNNAMAQFGQKFDNIAKSQQVLELENRNLENEIAQKSTLNNIASESASLGFVKPKTVQYLR